MVYWWDLAMSELDIRSQPMGLFMQMVVSLLANLRAG